MEMENFVDDLPLPVNLEQSEEVGKAMYGPVFEFEPYGGDGLDDVDAGDASFELCGGAVLIVPVIELLDWTSKQVCADVAENRGVRMERFFHHRRVAVLATLHVELDRVRDCVVLLQLDCVSSERLFLLHKFSWAYGSKN